MMKPERRRVYLLALSSTFAKQNNVEGALREMNCVLDYRRVTTNVFAVQVHPYDIQFPELFNALGNRCKGSFLLIEANDFIKGSLPKHQWHYVQGRPHKSPKKPLPA
jgi:hypothetical protein